MKKEYLKKVQTIESTIQTAYDCLAGEQGDERNWELYRFLYHPNSQMIRFENDFVDGEIRPQYMSPYDFTASIGKYMEKVKKTGFYEREIHKITEVYGHIAHVWSTCESFTSKKDMDNNNPYVRNVHSFQLAYYQERWWIINLYWYKETDEFPIPKEFLGIK
ncbi:hypothetical protein [Eudoraea adriatica]|uniref:hypothetical protein n=1 Tax=Eudoraea adriatica TaxID=446681 RepID=UPI000371D0B1|nr:hypothetical protein [Eudoraea adriatica]